MKNLYTIMLIALSAIVSVPFQSNAQGQVFDLVSIGAGYTNQAFYSLENGEVSNVTNTDWELGFQITGFQATILVNGKNNVRLFRSGFGVNDWANITPLDTVGALNPTNELLNQDTSWWSGAFNITADTANQFDLGWGNYDFATHAVTGDSLFFLKMPSGDVMKIWIQSLQNNIYYFAYANVDGTGEVNTTLPKSAFTGKNFGYYSITNGVTVDREPNKYIWDLTFAQYMSAQPFPYKVSGVLANDSVSVAKAYPVDVATTLPWGQNYSYHINTIGYNWKAYDFNTNAWLIEDSTVFFVYDRPGSLWKLVFTNFGGSLNGNYEFYKEKITQTGIAENNGNPVLLNIAPNPSNGSAQLTLFVAQYSSENYVAIYDLSGRQIHMESLPANEGLYNLPITLNGVQSGTYLVKVVAGNKATVQKLVISEN